MCCYGCHAVASSIVGAGLDDYYRFRTGLQRELRSSLSLQSLLALDAPEVQASFVWQAQLKEKGTTLSIEGMTCAACAWLIESKVRQLKGVTRFSINATSQRAALHCYESQVLLSDVLHAIHKLGYSASPFLMHESEQSAIQKVDVF